MDGGEYFYWLFFNSFFSGGEYGEGEDGVPGRSCLDEGFDLGNK